VWELLDASDASGARTGCNRIVLFLTDGEPDAFGDADFDGIAARAAAQVLLPCLSLHFERLRRSLWVLIPLSLLVLQGEGFHLMTYALGSGARTDYLKRLACDNRGVTCAAPLAVRMPSHACMQCRMPSHAVACRMQCRMLSQCLHAMRPT
tara:strand:+ start:1561 stop:2013 length:453 start_codon:yes stop_codon:yes gene_type:complete